jgi:hypothetical protein
VKQRAAMLLIRRTLVVLGLLVLLSGDVLADELPATAPGGSVAQQDLAAVDRAFFSAYERAGELVITNGPPALLVVGDEIILHRGGNRRSLPLLPPLFDELKAVAHVPLGLFAILTPSDGAPLDDATLAELTRFRASIVEAQGAVARAGFPAAQRERQDQIIAASLELADRALAARRVARDELVAFTRGMAPFVLQNVDEAVGVYLGTLNGAVRTLLAEIPTQQRANLVVLVTGVHQARIDNAAMQYFDRLLGNPPTIAQRVIYAENVRDERGALHLLGIHVMARRVGTAFFKDPTYMNSDLFGREAKRYVPGMTLPALAP